MTTSSTPSPVRGKPRARGTDVSGAGGRGRDSRAAILEAAQALLLESGIEGMSIRKLGRRCGYTAPTIYHHFGDKAGLVAAVVDERFREVHEVMLSIPRGGDAARYLNDVARAFLEFALENPEHYRLLSLPGLEPGSIPSAESAREMVKDALEQLAREGTLATRDIDAAYETTWAMLHGLISLRLTRPEYPFSDQMIELAFQMMEGGLLRRGALPR
ncbi:MAG: TetR/AcrR family transcriptional regulator [Myxococcota bacterium]